MLQATNKTAKLHTQYVLTFMFICKCYNIIIFINIIYN